MISYLKYIVLLCDGMADIDDGEGTPMSLSVTPNMDALSKKSEIGLVKTVPDAMSPGSDIANLSVMGYDPSVYYTGRSPLEAVSMGIDLLDSDVTLRCNLVTLSDEPEYSDKTMVDYCAGDISSEEAAELMAAVNNALSDEEFCFYNGVSYRHCLVWKNGSLDIGKLTPPHDITGKPIKAYLNHEANAEKLMELMRNSVDVLKFHPINLKRIAENKSPANSIWLWGAGNRPQLDGFYEKFGLKGSVISAVDLLKGIGVCAGMSVPEVPDVTGYIDTNFEGKVAAAISELKGDKDFVYIHIEAPDECGHRGERTEKIRSLELIDSRALRPLLDSLNAFDDYRLLILPDHPTPLSLRTHTNEAVPYLLYQKSRPLGSGGVFTEKGAADTGIYIEPGHDLIKKLLEI